MVNTGEYYGSQCVYLPKWFIPNITSQELMMSDSPRGMAFDGVLNYMAGQTPVNLGLMVSIPDLAHHTSPRGPFLGHTDPDVVTRTEL